MTIGPTDGYNEFINKRNKAFKVPNSDPKIMSYQDYMDLVYKGVYLDNSYQIQVSYEEAMQIAKKEMVEQDRELLEQQITTYLLKEYDEKEKIQYSWKEFFEVFFLVVYNVLIFTIAFQLPLVWRFVILISHVIVLIFGGIFYSKIKKHYKDQKEIDDLLCQYGVAAIKNESQHEEILYQQLVDKKVF